MEKKQTNILLFENNKRNRETHLRRSILSFDDTDFLMEVRSARRRSIEIMANDDLLLSGVSPTNWKRVWSDFSISPDNIRNVFPRSRGSNELKEVEEEEEKTPLEVPNLDVSKTKSDEGSSSIEASSSSSSKASLSLSKPSSSSVTSTTDSSQTKQAPHHAWYNRLGALARREQQQRKDYHDTLDEHHEAKNECALRKFQNHPYNFRNWQQRKSSRDGLDFSRDVALALRHASIYAMADSLTALPSCDAFGTDAEISDENENRNVSNGYIQDTRRAANTKTRKCVLDLIA